ncbi:VOC family protein [Fodinicola acaciae]|uniref:VOC family protein n=1 Tax=Fodinicola acaciae TaxID=2681555 RepID=UPI0013D1DDB3|nr:VOC family protein [Fodinicola acaciae]
MTAADLAPEEFPGVTPHLVVRSVAAAVAFYQRVFGADELQRQSGPDGRIWHCELLVAGGRLLLVEEFPDMEMRSPQTIGGTPVMLHIFVTDVDDTFNRAVDAGAEPAMKPVDTFWGDRYAQVVDPQGHRWSFGLRKDDLSAEQTGTRARRWSAERGHPNSPADVPEDQRGWS